MASGDWWARGADPLLNGEASIGADDLDAGAVTAVKLEDGAVTSAKIDDDAIVTDHIQALNVTSECLSANAVQRTVMIPIPAQPAGTASPLTSAYLIWTPKTAVVINGLTLWMQSSWVMTTVQSTPLASVFTTGSTDIGTVYIPAQASGTTQPLARGVQWPITVAYATLGAGKSMAFGCSVAASSGMVQPDMTLQVDYVTSA